jgi:hypothetical protein
LGKWWTAQAPIGAFGALIATANNRPAIVVGCNF